MAPHTPTGLNTRTALLLLLPPLLWAGNAVVGRVAAPWIAPITFNFLRWLLAALLLLPLAGWVLRPHSPAWPQWRRFALLGLFGIAGFNMLQYLALHTSTPMNVTLVGASSPVWMLLVGRLFFHAPMTARAVVGAALSLLGVLVVVSRGELDSLAHLHLVPGDGWMLLAACAWAGYSWLLTRHDLGQGFRHDWAAFMLVQIAIGLFPAALMTAGEWVWLGSQAAPGASAGIIQWSWPLAAVLLFVAVGPSLLAYRCWGLGVQAAGPTIASFFGNLTPLFAALMSALFLGEPPQPFHALAFALIVAGIALPALRR